MDTFNAIRLAYPEVIYACLALILGALLFIPSLKNDFICINKHSWDIFHSKAKKKFEYHAFTLLKEGLEKGRSAFRLVTNMGTYLILTDNYAEEIKNDDRFSAFDAVNDVLLVDIPGFETMFQGSLHNHVSPIAIRAMNRELVNLTSALSEETVHCLQNTGADKDSWHEVSIHELVLDSVAHMTTRAFLGSELCRNSEWLEIAKSFTMNRFIAVAAIQSWPKLLHPLVHWFLPPCKIVRSQIARARKILMPVLEHERRASLENQSTNREFSNLMFIDQYANGTRYDATMSQMRLIAVAFQTTSDMIEKVLARICKHPELIQPLRDEVISVFAQYGLNSKSLLKLTLMESVMKESQRLEPAVIISMFRVAREKVTLKDGTVVPKGTSLAFANNLRFDPEMYPSPEEFDGYRFQKMREDPKKSTLAPFTKTRMSHLAFGHGKSSCPGRFLACDEAKLILSHLLLNFDIKAVDGQLPELQIQGMFIQLDPKAKMLIKHRESELSLHE
ncbi:hypothetical protein PMG11_03152 [Penicillium brasilianum]|uniref:Cytochrome P450 n=2 Tax=Penicillium brasilianum TaxID=104259 RepID=A0A0F7VGP9_PENBI|nr:hypothetical protein PMG11_03152 [Penicillium brasilianum]